MFVDSPAPWQSETHVLDNCLPIFGVFPLSYACRDKREPASRTGNVMKQPLKSLKVAFKNIERSTRQLMEQSVCLVNIIKTHSIPQYSYTTVLSLYLLIRDTVYGYR
jgi:hypothetical protein